MDVIRAILADQTSNRLLLFLVLNLSFAWVELVYGMWANSLGLISDSFHMFFDCSALLAGLVATVISQWEANEYFSFGYLRAEIMAGFINGICLLFVAFFIFSEAVKRVLDPPMVHHERLLAVSVAGFFVNLLGIFVFHHGHSHEQGSVCPSRASVSRKHSIIFTDPRLVNDLRSSHFNIPDSRYIRKHSSLRSSFHGFTHSDQEPSYRNMSDHANNPPSDPASDPIHPDLTDQEWSQKDDSHVTSDHEPSPVSDPDRSRSEHNLGNLLAVPTDLRRTNSGLHYRPPKPSFVVFADAHSHKTAETGSEIVQGVYLHIVADALGSVGVIVSSTLIDQFGWVISDPICSMFISALVIMSVVPLLHESICILMQRTPVALEQVLPLCFDKVRHLEGVLSIEEPHFWTLCTDVYVGALTLEVEPNVDSQEILNQTHIIFYEAGVRHLHVQIEAALA